MNRDPGDETEHQDSLFDPRTTIAPKCGHCGTTAKNACVHDADIDNGIRDPYARRPKTCIAGWDPATAEIPF